MTLSDYLFSPRGRINRAKYWLYVVVSIAILIVAGAAMSVVWVDRMRAGMGAPVGAVIVLGIVYLILLIVGIFVGIKRLHDRDKSGWWLLVFYLVPMLLGWVSAILSRHGIGFLFALGSLAFSIWALVELGCRRGTAGPNRYGEDPLAPAS